jgi:tetratricopeptide (TPR) repeat protein
MSQPLARTRVPRLILVGAALCSVLVLAGCEELSARRSVQKGNTEYEEQNYDKAAAHFEDAIKSAPDLEIAHHNLGITYSRLFKPGVDTPANKAYADKATEHLGWWLSKYPDDSKIRKLITGIWIDAGEYDKALVYWKKEHDRDPKSRDVLQVIAGIYLKSGDWRESLVWYRKDVDAAPDAPAKVAALTSIVNVCFGKLFSGREKVFATERAEIAEIGLAAAEEGIKLDEKVVALWGTSQGLWDQRSLANGQSWAYFIDRTESQVYSQRARVLREEAKKAEAAAAAGASAAPKTPANGT